MSFSLPIIAVAFLLRAYRLGEQSLWGDEAWSVFFARLEWADMTVWLATIDRHPPLYFIFLKLWLPLTGSSELALRYLSLAFSILTLALLMRLAAKILGERGVLLAGLLLGFSAFDVYLAQEARMYTLLALLALLTTHLLIKTREKGRLFLLILYGMTGAAMLYTHYFGLFVLAAQAVAGGFRARKILAAQGLAVASFLPWGLAYATSAGPQWGLDFTRLHPTALWRVLQSTGEAFIAGMTLDPSYAQLAALLLFPFVLAGMVWAFRRLTDTTLIVLSLVVPLVGIMASLPYLPYFFPRYLSLAFWAYLLLLTSGLLAAGRWHWAGSLIPLMLFLSTNAWSLHNLYTQEIYNKSGYRSMIKYLKSHMADGDVLMLNTHNQVPLFAYYSGGLPYRVVQPVAGVDVAREMEEAARSKRGLWLLLLGNVSFYDPQREVEGWLARHAFFGRQEGFGDVSLSYYALAQEAEDPYYPIEGSFGSLLALEGYRLGPARPGSGESLRLSLSWRALAPMEKNYTVFVHLLDARRVQIAGVDSQPQAGLSPTSSWRPGQVVEDRYALRIPSGAAPGLYHIEVGLYGPDGQRLPLAGGRDTSLLLGPVEVPHPSSPEERTTGSPVFKQKQSTFES